MSKISFAKPEFAWTGPQDPAVTRALAIAKVTNSGAATHNAWYGGWTSGQQAQKRTRTGGGVYMGLGRDDVDFLLPKLSSEYGPEGTTYDEGYHVQNALTAVSKGVPLLTQLLRLLVKRGITRVPKQITGPPRAAIQTALSNGVLDLLGAEELEDQLQPAAVATIEQLLDSASPEETQAVQKPASPAQAPAVAKPVSPAQAPAVSLPAAQPSPQIYGSPVQGPTMNFNEQPRPRIAEPLLPPPPPSTDTFDDLQMPGLDFGQQSFPPAPFWTDSYFNQEYAQQFLSNPEFTSLQSSWDDIENAAEYYKAMPSPSAEAQRRVIDAENKFTAHLMRIESRIPGLDLEELIPSKKLDFGIEAAQERPPPPDVVETRPASPSISESVIETQPARGSPPAGPPSPQPGSPGQAGLEPPLAAYSPQAQKKAKNDAAKYVTSVVRLFMLQKKLEGDKTDKAKRNRISAINTLQAAINDFVLNLQRVNFDVSSLDDEIKEKISAIEFPRRSGRTATDGSVGEMITGQGRPFKKRHWLQLRKLMGGKRWKKYKSKLSVLRRIMRDEEKDLRRLAENKLPSSSYADYHTPRGLFGQPKGFKRRWVNYRPTAFSMGKRPPVFDKDLFGVYSDDPRTRQELDMEKRLGLRVPSRDYNLPATGRLLRALAGDSTDSSFDDDDSSSGYGSGKYHRRKGGKKRGFPQAYFVKLAKSMKYR